MMVTVSVAGAAGAVGDGEKLLAPTTVIDSSGWISFQPWSVSSTNGPITMTWLPTGGRTSGL